MFVFCWSWLGSWGVTTRRPRHRWGKTCISSRYARRLTSHFKQLTIPQADTSNFTTDPQTILNKVDDAGNKFDINNDLLDALTGAASSKELKDFYQVGLWSYCEGEKKDGVEKITYCSSSKTQFWFNPVEVWGLQNTSVQNVLGDDLQKGLNTYKKVAGWMNWAFIIATILTAAEFVVGFFAIFSRWGSLVTTILSTVRLFILQHTSSHTNNCRHRPSSPLLLPRPLLASTAF